ncbi:MAG: hypothetical protein QG671_360 [Actinomycetota bacterium]|nr:hypothetical protein [Actinomycetota bacterium]
MVRLVLPRFFGRLATGATLPAVRAGVVGAAVSVAGSYSRGLLPRSAKDQALATGVTAACHYLVTATAAAAAESIALYASGDHTVRDRKAPSTALVATDLGMVVTGILVERALPPHPDEPMQRSLTRFVAHFAMMGGTASSIVTVIDEVLRVVPGGRYVRNRSLLIDALAGAVLATVAVNGRHRRAARFGLVDPDRPAVTRASVGDTARAAGIGVSAGAGLLAVAAAEQFIAHQASRALFGHVGSVEIGSPLSGHAVALGLFGATGLAAFVVVKRRTERHGDVVEAAYPEPPTNPWVTAGPRSLIDFDAIGKEGRRFVLMTLTADEIEAVMGEPAENPVRVVAGYEAAGTTAQRAELCLLEMEAVGAFERSVICVASPTGVGYVSYVFAESLEYLTLGDCAIVMPQYALVPSALALSDTGDGAELQRLVLAGINAKLSQLPVGNRPKVVQFGESLGAQVALDIAHPQGAKVYQALGVDAGLYLGVPFRTEAWNTWIHHRERFDPDLTLVAVSEPGALATLGADRRNSMRHLMVVHHDDPVNKFGYRVAVRPPWWMGKPETRPPKVPREVLWRPITTFILTLVDLKNGMQFTPGSFVRRGHDYRIDTAEAVRAAFGLECSPEQAAAIEAALRKREVDWARRRLVARKFAAARDSINSTLSKWGVNLPKASLIPDSIPNMDLSGYLDSMPDMNAPMTFVVADQDPNPSAP